MSDSSSETDVVKGGRMWCQSHEIRSCIWRGLWMLNLKVI